MIKPPTHSQSAIAHNGELPPGLKPQVISSDLRGPESAALPRCVPTAVGTNHGVRTHSRLCELCGKDLFFKAVNRKERKGRKGSLDEDANHSSGVRSATTLVAASDPERMQSGTPIPA